MLNQWKPGYGATALDNASNYMGPDLSHMLCAPCTTHRDANTLQRSNWECMLAEFREHDPDEELHEVHRFGNWAVGWTEVCLIKPGSRLVAIAEDIQTRDYPILDEDHHSELEWNEVCEAWESASVSDRVDYLQRSGSDASIFAARRPELPQDDNGHLYDYLRTD